MSWVYNIDGILFHNQTNYIMSKGTIISGIIALIIIVGGAYYFYFGSDSLKFWQPAKSTQSSITPVVPTPHETITAKHQYKNSTHIIAGEVNLPTACYVLTTSARVAESMPEQVSIDFVSKTQGEMCAQVITTERFKVDFKASDGAIIKATWNGQPVELNLIPAGVNEDLNNFEIFNKG